MVAILVAALIPTSTIFAQSTPPSGPDIDVGPLLLAIVAVIILLAIPAVYFFWNKKRNPSRSLLMVSTDEQARALVKQAALHVGYNAITVYRYEDALDKLR